MRKEFLFLSIIFLVSCNGNINSNDDSLSMSNSSDGTVSYAWNDEIKAEMSSALGEYIPYIEEFGINYEYIKGMMQGSSIPYINPYWYGVDDFSLKYAQALEQAQYVYEGTEVDEEDKSHVSTNYVKTKSNGDLYVQYSYYATVVDGNNTTCFEIYTWLENGGGGGLEIPTEFDFAFDAESFGQNGQNYDQSNKEFSNIPGLGSAVIKANYVMNFQGQIQMKKGAGVLYNETELPALDVVYLDGLTDFAFVKVSAGNSASSLTEVNTYNDVYNLNGAKYFKIEALNRQVVKLNYIGFVLQ